MVWFAGIGYWQPPRFPYLPLFCYNIPMWNCLPIICNVASATRNGDRRINVKDQVISWLRIFLIFIIPLLTACASITQPGWPGTKSEATTDGITFSTFDHRPPPNFKIQEALNHCNTYGKGLGQPVVIDNDGWTVMYKTRWTCLSPTPKIQRMAVQPAPRSASAPQPKAAPLVHLDALYRQNLISKKEYGIIRKRILSK